MQIKPFVDWIWAGCLLMAFGSVLAVSDRRYRLAVREKRDKQEFVERGSRKDSDSSGDRDGERKGNRIMKRFLFPLILFAGLSAVLAASLSNSACLATLPLRRCALAGPHRARLQALEPVRC
ncbi:MAG: Cytochrome c heme lyase subunit CcmF [uncultured Caballeronia sp.]|nr:MAG: Cytochrome c heme lyase subunit CcmF [uncultured Caballeronia sp.]